MVTQLSKSEEKWAKYKIQHEQLAQVVHHQILVLECKASKAQRLKRTATKIENDKNPFLKL